MEGHGCPCEVRKEYLYAMQIFGRGRNIKILIKYQPSSHFLSIQDRQRTYKRNIQARSCNHCCRGKAISITYSECVFVALVIQHAMRIRHIVMRPVRLHHMFPHYLIKGTIFEKTLLNIKCVF
jgi:hypothetical protein